MTSLIDICEDFHDTEAFTQSENDIELSTYDQDEQEDNYYDWKYEIQCQLIDDWNKYQFNKEAKVGDTIKCANALCQKSFTKKSYQQAFCCTKCKDKFWNRQRQFDIK